MNTTNALSTTESDQKSMTSTTTTNKPITTKVTAKTTKSSQKVTKSPKTTTKPKPKTTTKKPKTTTVKVTTKKPTKVVIVSVMKKSDSFPNCQNYRSDFKWLKIYFIWVL